MIPFIPVFFDSTVVSLCKSPKGGPDFNQHINKRTMHSKYNCKSLAIMLPRIHELNLH